MVLFDQVGRLDEGLAKSGDGAELRPFCLFRLPTGTDLKNAVTSAVTYLSGNEKAQH